MRKPETIERLYLDFDGFFASVMQQAMPEIRGRPVGVIPFEIENADHTIVIACSKEAKAAGCQNVMPVPVARQLCPDIVLVMQRPDLFRRANIALLNEIRSEIPIDTVKSIDELTCILDKKNIEDPLGLATRLKARLAKNIGSQITCSIGFAPNRMLAKIACKLDKPNGVTIWQPDSLKENLSLRSFDDIPGIGESMQKRLAMAGIHSVAALWETQPKQLRHIWGNVNGERMWYALHGYDIYALPTSRGMYGHARVLPPDWRSISQAQEVSRLLVVKAARRMRREGWYSNKLSLWLDIQKGGWYQEITLPCINDDHAALVALDALWRLAKACVPAKTKIIRVGTTFMKLTPGNERQLDLLLNDDVTRKKWENITHLTDTLNRKYSKRVLTIGPWSPPPGGYVGGKISYTRIPSAEDFY